MFKPTTANIEAAKAGTLPRLPKAEQDKIVVITLVPKISFRRRLQDATDTTGAQDESTAESAESAEYELDFDYKTDIWDQ